MIIIRNTRLDPLRDQQRLERNIRNQAITGIIVLPEYCELLHADTGENKVVIKKLILTEDGKISSIQIPGDPV